MAEATYERYLFEYRFADVEWAFEVLATSPDEAAERLKAISWAQYKGRIVASVSTKRVPLISLARIRAMIGL